MRRAACLLIGAAVGLLSPLALAQQAAPLAPKAGTEPAPAAAPTAPEDPPYNPMDHGGLAYGTWLRATRGTGRRSTGMMITGITLVAVGVTLLGAGTGVYANGSTCAGTAGPTGPNGNQLFLCGPQAGLTSGLALMASGVIGLGIGLPLTFLGAAEVPRAEAGQAGGTPQTTGQAGAPQTQTPRATVALGATGATFVLRF
jgi:hypothetical protein